MSASADTPTDAAEPLGGWTWVDDDGVEHWIPDCVEHDGDDADDGCDA